MYQVKTTISYPGQKQRIRNTGVFMPADKKKAVKKEKIIEQTTAFLRQKAGIPNTFDRDKLKIKVEVTKIKADYFIAEDKID